ncbi:hypothetical protein HU200_008025 [Digitaria exilis]|uniref:Uncharacterized protein n=1 Tax=Digitaria exilis TaxID=1010633 RepID=A0A835FLT9_9POAL|nr:hypothetical protein HU200_008025 [Digitaria exilis]
MRAHPSWQRPLSSSHLFFLFFFVPLRTPTQRLLQASPYLASLRRQRLTSVRSTNNYRSSSNNYQYRETIPRGGAEEEIPPASHAQSTPPPPPPPSTRASDEVRKHDAVRQICKPKQRISSDHQLRVPTAS